MRGGSTTVFLDAGIAGFIDGEGYVIQVLASTRHPNGTRVEQLVYEMSLEQFSIVLGDPMDDPSKKKKMIIMVFIQVLGLIFTFRAVGGCWRSVSVANSHNESDTRTKG